MPQCQFPVFCCFCFQKSTSANILGIGRNESPRPYFFRSVPEDRRGVDEGQQGAHTIGRRGAPLCRAAIWCGGPAAPPTLPLRLYIAPDAKTLKEQVIFQKGFRSAAAIDDKFRGTEVSVPARCRDGELPPESSPSTPPPSSSPLLTPMMRRE